RPAASPVRGTLPGIPVRDERQAERRRTGRRDRAVFSVSKNCNRRKDSDPTMSIRNSATHRVRKPVSGNAKPVLTCYAENRSDIPAEGSPDRSTNKKTG